MLCIFTSFDILPTKFNMVLIKMIGITKLESIVVIVDIITRITGCMVATVEIFPIVNSKVIKIGIITFIKFLSFEIDF